MKNWSRHALVPGAAKERIPNGLRAGRLQWPEGRSSPTQLTPDAHAYTDDDLESWETIPSRLAEARMRACKNRRAGSAHRRGEVLPLFGTRRNAQPGSPSSPLPR